MSRDLNSIISHELDERRTERKDLQSQMNDMRTGWPIIGKTPHT